LPQYGQQLNGSARIGSVPSGHTGIAGHGIALIRND